MPHVSKLALAAAVVTVVLGSLPGDASARGGRFPMARCGPDLAYLCPIRGYFDQAPFQYKVAIYPGCIKVMPVETPYGIQRQRVLVCGAPERPMIWW